MTYIDKGESQKHSIEGKSSDGRMLGGTLGVPKGQRQQQNQKVLFRDMCLSIETKKGKEVGHYSPGL